jgi:hypothetical protein
MATTRPGVTGLAVAHDLEPLAISFQVSEKVSGLGRTSLWKAGKEGRIRLIHPPGMRQTLIDYPSLKKLLSPDPIDTPQPRPRGRTRKLPAGERYIDPQDRGGEFRAADADAGQQPRSRGRPTEEGWCECCNLLRIAANVVSGHLTPGRHHEAAHSYAAVSQPAGRHTRRHFSA